MSVQIINTPDMLRKLTTRKYFLPLFIAFVFALTIHPGKAQAQIVGNLEVNIPFQFHAGNTRFPAGLYRIHMLDDSDLSIMEISSADGSTSALFQVEDSRAASAPAHSQLIFNRYGNRYFLAQVHQQGNTTGSQVLESRYEKGLSKQTIDALERVPANPLQ
jgi:hypothetical protein